MIRHDAATKVLPSPSNGLPKIRNVELQELIGRGQTADVYLGIHERLRRAVAVKILHDHLSETPEAVNRFRQEASVIADLHHPGIMQIHDLDEVDGRSYIVMEYLSGPTLAQHMTETARKRSHVPVRDVIRIVSQVADALGFAHKLGILHRDVKPANIVLRSSTKEVSPGGALPPDAMPVLTDFGLARLSHQPRVTRDGLTVGTPAYMSPEQVMGTHLDERSDIYSLGVILYEMLTGDLPPVRDSDSLTSVMYKQVHEEFPRLPAHLRRLQPIVDQCLAKDREKRFASTADLIDALQGYHDAYLGPEGARASVQRSRLDIVALRGKLMEFVSPKTSQPSEPNGKARSTLLSVRGLRDVLLRPAGATPRLKTRPARATNLNLNLLRKGLLPPSEEVGIEPERSRSSRNRWAVLAILAGVMGFAAIAWVSAVVPAWRDRVLSAGGAEHSGTKAAVPGEAGPAGSAGLADATPTAGSFFGGPSGTSTSVGAGPLSSATPIPPTPTSPPPSATPAPTDPPPILPPLPTLPPILPTTPPIVPTLPF